MDGRNNRPTASRVQSRCSPTTAGFSSAEAPASPAPAPRAAKPCTKGSDTAVIDPATRRNSGLQTKSEIQEPEESASAAAPDGDEDGPFAPREFHPQDLELAQQLGSVCGAAGLGPAHVLQVLLGFAAEDHQVCGLEWGAAVCILGSLSGSWAGCVPF